MQKIPLDIPVIYLDKIDSTNNEAARHLRDAPHASVWVAGFQSAGRGQQENYWESEADKNLLFSILFRPQHFRAEEQFMLSQAVSLGICDYLRSEGIPAKIKWPNDIYAGNKKITGILIENHISGEMIYAAIAGIGLNVNQKIFHRAPNPTSMCRETGKIYSLEAVLSSLLCFIFDRYHNYSDLQADYLSVLYRYGEWAWYESEKGRFTARIVAVQPSGELALEHKTGQVEYFLQKSILFL